MEIELCPLRAREWPFVFSARNEFFAGMANVEQHLGPVVPAVVEPLEEAVEVVESDRSAIDLCLGTVSEMGGEAAVLAAIRALGPRGKIAYVHFRDVRGSVPVFEECFLGEGNFRPLRVMRALRANGFTGFILDDHAPGLIDDSDYGHRGRAHAIGYIQGLLESIEEDRNGD